MALDGDVVVPGDRDYERLRGTTGHSGSPAVIVRCHTPADVKRAIRDARREDLVVSVRSGGHGAGGFGTNEGGLVIDLSPMRGVDILDRSAGTVRLGPGGTWGEVAAALAPHGLAISAGDTTTVGVGGVLLGGGIGWMVRKYGLTLDSLVAAEVVTADGQELRASANEHPDLFWALRGGGGNFGVVTAFEVTARAVDTVRLGSVTYPAADAGAVLRRWRDAMREAPDDVTSIARLLPAPDGPPQLVVTACDVGDDPKALDALRNLGSAANQDIRTVPYPEALQAPGELPPSWQPKVTNWLAPSCTDALIDAVITNARRIRLPMVVDFRGLGAALGRVAPDATAFAHRASEVLVATVLLGSAADQQQVAAEVDAFSAALAEHVDGAHSNFLSASGDEVLAAVYPPDTLARLVEVKRTYDPDNIFNQNLNIDPRRARG